MDPVRLPKFTSGRRDFAPYTAPAQSHHPLLGFVVNWRPREFGSTLKPDAIKAVPSAEFTSGRRDLNPGPLPPQGSALPSCPFWLTDLPPLHRKLLRIEQLSGTTSSQNILESTFSAETQKICGVSSGLVGD